MTFAQLHSNDSPLLLPNAWDVGSALAFIEAGFAAVGTTSFGIAAAAGRPDGERSAKRGTRTLVDSLRGLPAYITADIEDGFSADPVAVAEYVSALAVAGVNLEDSSSENLIDPALHAAKIAAIKARSPGVFVNARTDTYWLGSENTVEDTLKRARAYVDAGADGIFIPGATRPEDLARFTAALPVPVNVLLVPGLSITDLSALGVRRVSTGSLPYRAALDAAVGVATAARDGLEPARATSYAESQARLFRFANGSD